METQSIEDFLANLLTATVVKREGRQRPLQWQRQLPPGRVEYLAKLRQGNRALYVTIGTDQEHNSPVVRVQLRGPARDWEPGRMGKVLEVYDLDVEDNPRTRQTFEILRQAVASQVAANERQKRSTARVSQLVELRAEVGPEVAGVLEAYFTSNEEEEEEE